MSDKITLISRINKRNNQINFQLKKSILPKEIRTKLPSLKGIKINVKDFEFE